MNLAVVPNMATTSNDKSVSQTVKKYGKQLRSFIKGKVNMVEDAEDILQEVWYQLSKLSNMDELENMSAWLYSVSKNKITDFYRKRKTERLELENAEDEDGTFLMKEVLLLDESQNSELALFKELFWNELFKALDELPENQRKVFMMNEIDDKTLQEIADELDENIKTIISRKGYAVKHLRNKLKPLYQELNF
jgi:RNA polymerase sigma factor (sigma-70 family)